jgi:hypothetical protein
METGGRLEDIQITLCKHYQHNIMYPLIGALILLIFRWFVVYRLMNRESRAYTYVESGTDIGIGMLIIVSILWIGVN